MRGPACLWQKPDSLSVKQNLRIRRYLFSSWHRSGHLGIKFVQEIICINRSPKFQVQTLPKKDPLAEAEIAYNIYRGVKWEAFSSSVFLQV
jgi:hypothetical protein